VLRGVRQWCSSVGALGAVLWNVVSNIIYDGMLKSDSKMEVVVNTIEVIIKHGNDTIIVLDTFTSPHKTPRKTQRYSRV
jgi:hypothetical protein